MFKKLISSISFILVLDLVLMTVAKAVDPSLVGWWKFDEGSGTTATDSSGNGNHGAIVGPAWTAGKVSKALNFDGVDDYVRIPANPVLNNLNAITFSAWIYPRVDAHWHILDKGDGDKRIYAEGLSLTLDGRVRYTGTHAFAQSLSNTLVLNAWQHVALTWSVSDNTVRVYHNGVEVTYTTHTTGSGAVNDDTNTPYTIGVRGDIGGLWMGDYFDGIIDDVRIYDYAMSQEEIPKTMRGDPLCARNPSPADGSTLNIKNAIPLSWSPGDNASQHDVYFGLDENAVDNADASDTSGIYRVRQVATSYTPPEGVEWGGGPYYWRIDEYNRDGTINKGHVWSFIVANFIVIDDFESYNNLDPDDPASNRIFNAWVDGYDDPTNGSLVGHIYAPFAEQTIVHGGGQSMPFAYNNAVGKSEATLTLTNTRDWTQEDVGVLSIWYQGDAANAAESMYVVLNGSAVFSHENPDAALTNTWAEWRIDLQVFADHGVNLSNVNTITIGFGNRTNPEAGGTGIVFFDDIRLYRPAP